MIPVQRQAPSAKLPSPPPVVRIKSLWKKYGRNWALRDINLNIDCGSVVTLIGSSGGGKSTLLRCINHLEPYQSGILEVEGQNVGYNQYPRGLIEVSDRELSQRRARIGMVFQDFSLFQHMNVRDNITFAPVLVKKEDKTVARRRAEELLVRMNIPGLGDRYPSELSGGQQQRVAIARALAMDPTLMLFDEPTSALDPELVGEVVEAIRDLAIEGRTMVLATHEMSLAKEISDLVVFMQNGGIVEAGHPDQIFNDPQDERTQRFLHRYLN